MSEEYFTARTATREHVQGEIAALSLPKTADGRYNFDEVRSFMEEVKRVLGETINPLDPENGMSGLLRSSKAATNPSLVAAIRSTHVETAKSVLEAAKKKAAAKKDD